MDDAHRAFRHLICGNMPFVILFGDIINRPIKLMRFAFFFHFSQSFSLVHHHEVVIFKIQIILNSLLDLLLIHFLPVIVFFNCLLLVLEDVLGSGNVFSCFPVALFDVDVLPLGSHVICHKSWLYRGQIKIKL